jgi:ATP-dependent DNA ligase
VVTFPIDLPLKPMLAKRSTRIPDGDNWLFEPKWDGFRHIVAREDDVVELWSRNERPFSRYFPELLDPLRDALASHCVVDGEVVVPEVDGIGLDFDALQQRIHPAESRVRRLAAETPAVFVAFDVLAIGNESWMDRPFRDRRAALMEVVRPNRSVFITPASTDPVVAASWFSAFEGAGLDGIVAKGLDDAYVPDKRVLVKVKHEREADCVLAGYRVHKDGEGVGSMLLGLYDDDGQLHHVGVAASFAAALRRELLEELAPLREGAFENHPWAEWAEFQANADAPEPDADGTAQRRPGAVSRWNAKKDLSWVPVRAERVVEVRFGQLESGRFRGVTSFVRWRPDRTPESCRYDQLEVASKVPFADLMAT